MFGRKAGKDAFPALAAIPRIWQARSSGQRTKGMEPFLLPARSTVRRVKKSRSGSIALKPQRRLPDKRPASHAAKAFSVRNAWRFSNHTTRRFTEKTRFSAWFGPDDAVPPPRISFFQRQNALACDNERIFCLPFKGCPSAAQRIGTRSRPRNTGTPQLRHGERQQGARFATLTPAMWSNFPLASGKPTNTAHQINAQSFFPLRG